MNVTAVPGGPAAASASNELLSVTQNRDREVRATARGREYDIFRVFRIGFGSRLPLVGNRECPRRAQHTITGPAAALEIDQHLEIHDRRRLQAAMYRLSSLWKCRIFVSW
jgi:hypothetical protein